MHSSPPFCRWLTTFLLFVLAAEGASAFQTVVQPGQWSDALTVVALPDGSLLVAQKSGRIDRLLAEGDGFSNPVAWADLGDEGRAELLGFAVAPDFLSSGYVYAARKVVNDEQAVVQVTRWRDAEGLVVLNRVLVDDLPAGNERSGGVLKVGPDGCLWLGLGDGGVPAAEVLPARLRGVLLRFNADGSLPTDNPNPNSPVWAWGFREPSGLAWQPGTDRLYALDRGAPIPKGTMDELNWIEKGADYGWPKHLGREVVKGVSKPVIYCASGHSWVPGGTTFITQGEWAGSLVFAGAGEGILYRLSLDTRSPMKILFYEELLGGDLGPLVDVALGSDDQPYLLSQERLYKLIP